MKRVTRPRGAYAVRALAGLTGVLVLSATVGCGGDPEVSQADDPAGGSGDAAAESDGPGRTTGNVCPDTLPEVMVGTNPAVDKPATSAPSLPEPDSAWVCRYDGRTGRDSVIWMRDGQGQPVPDADLADLSAKLDDLTPPEGREICTQELGPRYVVVLVSGDEEIGVVVDDFGCHDVRLTDDLEDTAPGDPGGDLPSGILASQTDLSKTLRTMVG